MKYQASFLALCPHRTRGSRSMRDGMALVEASVSATEADAGAFELLDHPLQDLAVAEGRLWQRVTRGYCNPRRWVGDLFSGRSPEGVPGAFRRTAFFPTGRAGQAAGTIVDPDAVEARRPDWREAGQSRLQAYLDERLRLTQDAVWIRTAGPVHWLDEDRGGYGGAADLADVPLTPLRAAAREARAMHRLLERGMHELGELRGWRDWNLGDEPDSERGWRDVPAEAIDGLDVRDAAEALPSAVLALSKLAPFRGAREADPVLALSLRGIDAIEASARLGPLDAGAHEGLVGLCADALQRLREASDPTPTPARVRAGMHLAWAQSFLLPRIRSQDRATAADDVEALGAFAP